MTRPEAIKRLQTWRVTGDRNHEAFDMAVDAMKRLQKIEDIVHDSRYSVEDAIYEVLYYVDTKRDIDL